LFVEVILSLCVFRRAIFGVCSLTIDFCTRFFQSSIDLNNRLLLMSHYFLLLNQRNRLLLEVAVVHSAFRLAVYLRFAVLVQGNSIEISIYVQRDHR
jgi:hypothetical protein